MTQPLMPRAPISLDGKVAIVTGGASGIGRATALHLANAGAKVSIADINEDLGMQTVMQIEEQGGEALFVRCDVVSPEDVDNLVKKTVSHFGELNLACNNAAIQGPLFSTTSCTVNAWDKVIDVNLRGVWLCMKYQIPEMIRAGGGAIVNISSTGGLVGFTGNPAYVASKHGVIGLTKTAALEFAQNHVRVNAVCPGSIETSLLQTLERNVPEVMKTVQSLIPQRRWGQPEEVTGAIVFLMSDHASYITGQALGVDGGWLAQ